MTIKVRNYQEPRFLLEGGPIEGGAPVELAPEAAPAEAGGADPMALLLQGAAMALQNQDCNTAMLVCQMLIEMAQGGGQGTPQEAPGEPVYRKGGVLKRWNKRV